MRFPNNRTLAKIGIYIAVAGISSVMYMRWVVESRIRNTEYFRSAFKVLRQHKGAVSILGEPIKNMGFDVGDSYNECDGKSAKFKVFIKGSKERGDMFFWATRDEDKGWKIERLEMEIKSQPDRRYLIKTLESPLLTAQEEK